MNRKLIRTLAIAAGVVVGIAAIAQEAPMPPQGGPQGGFQGGPQGGRRPQGGPMGGPRQMMGGPAILLRPEVRDELKLSDDQVKKIASTFHLSMGGPQGGPGMGGPGGRPPMGGPGMGGPGMGGPGGGPGGPEMGEGGPGMPPPPGEEGGPGMPPPPNGGPGFGQGPRGGGQGGPQGGPEGGPQGGRRGGGFRGGPEGGPDGMGPEDAQRVADADKKLKAILNDKQFARYHEISLQMAGPGAITRPDVAKQLGLSEDQITKIHAILEKNRPRPMGGQMGGPAGGPDGGREGRPPRPPQQGDENGRPPAPPEGEGFGGPQGGPQGGPGMGGPGMGGLGMGRPNREERKKVEAQILTVLTEAQKSQWKTMLGKPFEPRRPEGGRPPQD